MAVLALAACIPVTRAQVGYWKNSVVLFQRALRYAPNDLVLKCNLADGYYDQGQFDEAIRECRELIQLQPDYIHVYIRLGLALTQKGLWDEAISQYQRAIQLSPNDSFAHNNLGIALRQKGRYDEAIAQFQDVLRLDPGNAFARQNLNITLGMKGQ
jgi:superkiller protein 3